MSGYRVFQAHDGVAAEELCHSLAKIDLLVLNTEGTGVDTGDLVRRIRAITPGLPVLHIGSSVPDGLPADVPTLPDTFNAVELLASVSDLIHNRARPRLLP
jgi:CheY-like chemotaxis protein